MVSTPFGEHLKREREMRGVSLEEISAATRISTRFLEALESEQWDQLPGGVFNRGFIRSVARFLGLDEESLVAEYALETKGRAEAKPSPDLPLEPGRDWGTAVLAVLAIGALLAAGWFAYSRYGARLAQKLRQKPAASGVTAASTSPAAAYASPKVATQDPPGALSTPSFPLDLKIDAQRPAALKVLADGRTAFDGSILPGESKRFQAATSLEIRSSESSAVLLELNGQKLPPIGLPGQPASVRLTPSDLKSVAGGTH